MLYKITSISNIEALNKPDWSEYNTSNIKVASISKDKNSNNGFDLQSAIKENPDHLFVKIFAIEKDIVNDNGDAFSEEELKKAASTFVGVPVFCNHQNDDIEKARGKIVHSWYDEKEGGIYIVAKVDRVAYPTLCRGIEEKNIWGTSMGASVEASVCSICHNSSATKEEYCGCILNRKNKKFNGKHECLYHQSKTKVNGKEDKCPICGSKKGETKVNEYKDHKIFEHNYGVKFIENSFVVNPACHRCGVSEIFNIDGFQKKVASLKEQIIKLSVNDMSDNISICKVAGKEEITYLSEAMDKLEKVAKSMMAQKEHISMEYVSDLVETLANVQSITDELIEMGYGQLPSPVLTGAEQPLMPKTSTDIPPMVQPSIRPGGPSALNNTPQTSGNIETQPLSDLGTITKPKISSNNSGIKEDFIKLFSNLKERLSILSNSLDLTNNNIEKNNKESDIMETTKTGEISGASEKTASHDINVITEKQLADAKFTGERQNSAPDVVTEKQLDNPRDVNVTTSTSPQDRLGSADVITEKQLASVKSGHVARWGDFPDVITEKQWTDMSRLIGSVLSESQENIITEKQMGDFLSHHRYIAPDVITEKQLNSAKTDQTQRWAYKMDTKALVKSAMETLSDTIAFYGKTPTEIVKAASFINDSTKNQDKASMLILINALPHKSDSRNSEKSKYTYFSKLASSSVETPSTVDSIITSASDHIADMSTNDLLDAIKYVASNEKAMKQIEQMASNKIAKGPDMETVINKTAEFDKAIEETLKSEDGVYQIRATVEDIGTEINSDQFITASKKFAQTQVQKEVSKDLQTELIQLDADEDNGMVIATVKDITKLTEEEKLAVEKLAKRELPDFIKKKIEEKKEREAKEGKDGKEKDGEEKDEKDEKDEKKDETKDCNASRREDMIKQAQMLGGEMGGQGGASQAPGAGATLPTPPGAMAPGMGQGQQPPLESFEQSSLGDEMGEEENLLPKPPGSTCPVCTSSDVDVIGGKIKCNNPECGANSIVKVIIESDWPGVIDSGKTPEGPEGLEGPAGEAPKGEGFELPAAGAPATASTKEQNYKLGGIAIVTKYTPEIVKKMAEKKIAIGSISPLTGSRNTLKLDNNTFVCLDTGVSYKVSTAVDAKDPKVIYSQIEWNPTVLEAGCSECSRAKRAFLNSLKEQDITEEQFDKMDLKTKAETILKIKKAGGFKQIKTASVKSGTVLAEYKKAFTTLGDKFPIESCRERLARRFGENALALSGPCEGKPLYDCVCNSLKTAGVYSNNLAIKVAEIWGDKEGSIECLEDLVRMGYELKEASSICEGLKIKYAQFEDNLVEDLDSMIEQTDENGEMGNEVPPIDEMGVDPFEDIGGPEGTGETVTVEIPIEVLEKLDEAIDKATGEDTSLEPHHTEPLPEGDVTVDIPADTAESIDEVADEKLNEVIGEPSEEIHGEPGTEMHEEISEIPSEETAIEEVKPAKEPVIEQELGEKAPCGCPCSCHKEEKVEKHEKHEEHEEEKPEENKIEEKIEEEGKEYKEGEPGNKESSMDTEMSKLSYMKHGHINTTGESHLDLSGVLSVINKQADKVKTKPAQDVVGKIQDGKTLGDEPKFDAKKPDVPSGNALMGKEKESIAKGEEATIPTSDARMSGEKDNEKLKPELDDTATGGEDGQGNHKASVRDRINKLADNIKKAQETKVKRVNVQDDKDLGQISGDSFMGKEKDSIGEVPTANTTPSGTTGGASAGFLGKEKESIGDKPTEKDTPSIPVKDDRIKGEKDNEKIKPEKEDQAIGNASKGGVTAESEPNKIVQAEAFRLAGRMLQNNMIKPENLATKVAELSSYEVAQIKDLEKGMFETAKKGLNTPAGGLEQPLIISEASNVRDGKNELQSQLENLFSLTKRNKNAQTDNDIETRKAFGRL